MRVYPQPSSKGLAEKLQAHYRPADKIVMLGGYRYDLDFYLRTGKTSFVVLNWDDPRIKTADNWSRELYDAGLFEPDAASQLLIRPQQLVSKMCSNRVVDLWLVGNANIAKNYEYLRNKAPDLEDGKLRVWHVPAGPPLEFCAETPKIVPK